MRASTTPKPSTASHPSRECPRSRGPRDQQQQDRREDEPQHDHAERPDLREQQHRERRADLLTREADDDEQRWRGWSPRGRSPPSGHAGGAAQIAAAAITSWYCCAVQGSPASGAVLARRRGRLRGDRGELPREVLGHRGAGAGVVEHDGDGEARCRVGERGRRVAGHRSVLPDERSGLDRTPVGRVPGRARPRRPRAARRSGRRPRGGAHRRRAPARSGRDPRCPRRHRSR